MNLENLEAQGADAFKFKSIANMTQDMHQIMNHAKRAKNQDTEHNDSQYHLGHDSPQTSVNQDRIKEPD